MARALKLGGIIDRWSHRMPTRRLNAGCKEKCTGSCKVQKGIHAPWNAFTLLEQLTYYIGPQVRRVRLKTVASKPNERSCRHVLSTGDVVLGRWVGGEIGRASCRERV